MEDSVANIPETNTVEVSCKKIEETFNLNANSGCCKGDITSGCSKVENVNGCCKVENSSGCCKVEITSGCCMENKEGDEYQEEEECCCCGDDDCEA